MFGCQTCWLIESAKSTSKHWIMPVFLLSLVRNDRIVKINIIYSRVYANIKWRNGILRSKWSCTPFVCAVIWASLCFGSWSGRPCMQITFAMFIKRLKSNFLLGQINKSVNACAPFLFLSVCCFVFVWPWHVMSRGDSDNVKMMGLHYYTWNMSFTTNIIWSVSQADTEGLWFVTNHSLWRYWSVLVWTDGWGWILSILAQVYTHFLAVNEMENKVWLIWMFLLLWCASALMSECCTKAKGTRLCPWCLNQYQYRVMEFSICSFFSNKNL